MEHACARCQDQTGVAHVLRHKWVRKLFGPGVCKTCKCVCAAGRRIVVYKRASKHRDTQERKHAKCAHVGDTNSRMILGSLYFNVDQYTVHHRNEVPIACWVRFPFWSRLCSGLFINPAKYAPFSRTWEVDAASNDFCSILILLSGFPEAIGIPGHLDAIGLECDGGICRHGRRKIHSCKFSTWTQIFLQIFNFVIISAFAQRVPPCSLPSADRVPASIGRPSPSRHFLPLVSFCQALLCLCFIKIADVILNLQTASSGIRQTKRGWPCCSILPHCVASVNHTLPLPVR